MTDITDEYSRMSLGVGRIVGDTFSIFFRKLPAVLLLAFVPSILEVLVVSTFSAQVASGLGGGTETGESLSEFAFATIVGLVIGSVVTATIVQLTYDAKLNQPVRLGEYLAAAFRNLPAIFVLSLVSLVVYSVGFGLLILPGIWAYAVLSVFVPAIVIEGAGFSALGRSTELTRDYRWPIAGVLLLVFLCVILLSIASSIIPTLILFVSPDTGNLYLRLIAEVAMTGLGYGLLSVAVALIFARLKEIKEGVAVSDLVDVFR